ncbi:MAG: PTS galactosamine transporter subunit IIB [Herbinix sp.]|nr:PTS galactosamine transporter subunit IIB [Herbinix sp.]
MPNIVMTRIDNRLVHGQVGCSWAGSLDCNLIVVADDIAAADPVQQSLMQMTADNVGCGIRFFTLQKTIDVIHKASPSQKIFLIVRDPQSARKLVENGVPIDKLCIGNMHVGPNKRLSNDVHVYVDDKDLEDLRAIRNSNIEVYIQIAPGDKKFDFEPKK